MANMISYTYEFEDDTYGIPSHAVTACTNAECLYGEFGILAHFTNFLRGAGFVISEDTTLQLVRDNQMVVDQENTEGS